MSESKLSQVGRAQCRPRRSISANQKTEECDLGSNCPPALADGTRRAGENKTKDPMWRTIVLTPLIVALIGGWQTNRVAVPPSAIARCL